MQLHLAEDVRERLYSTLVYICLSFQSPEHVEVGIDDDDDDIDNDNDNDDDFTF